MKIKKLVMSAFGPYKDRIELDFVKNLDKDNMFVIAGNTGAGKTTIFDAIHFAIYGEASSKSREPKGLRSNFANDNEDTFVELVFMLKGNEYSVRRNPEYLRKKKSGEGFTTTKPNARLDINGGESFENGKTITGQGKVTEALKDILGINSEQFKQLVMIPQGEFRKLLEAKSEEKEKIFRKIFETDIINSFQEKLRGRTNEIVANTKMLIKRREIKAREFILKENSNLKPILDSKEININLALEGFLEEIKEENKSLDEKEALKKAISNEKEELGKVYQKAKYINNEIDEKVKVEIQVKTLLLGKQENKKREIERELGNKAILVLGKEEAYKKVNFDLEESKRKLKNLLEEKLKGEEKKLKALNESSQAENEALEIKEIDREIDYLKELKEKTGIYEEKLKSLKELESKEEKSKALIIELENEKLKLKAKTKKLENDLEECSKAKDSKVIFEKEKLEILSLEKDIKKLLIDINGALGIKEKIDSKAIEYKESIKTVEARQKLFNEAEDKFFRNQAGILARKLEDGCECPVCGSINHPKKAELGSETVTKEEVEKLKNAWNKVNTSFIELKSEIISLKEAFNEKESEVLKFGEAIFKESKSLEEYKGLSDEKLKGLEIREIEVLKILKNIELTLSTEMTIKRNLEINNKTFEAKDKALEENKKNINELSIEIIKEQKDIEEIQKKFNGEIKSLEELKEREEEIKEKKVRLEKNLTAKKEMLNAVTEKLQNTLGNLKGEEARMAELTLELEKSKDEYKKALSKNGFKSLEEYKMAKKTNEELRELELLINNYKDELNGAKKVLESKEKALEGKERADIQKIVADGKILRARIEKLDEEIKVMTSNIRSNERVVDGIKDLNKKLEKDEKENGVIGTISKIVNGDNDKKITLERYILASYLDDILRAANKRFSKMTSGRYRLLRKIEIGDKRSAQGLDLQVFDIYTNKERDVTSLSGGESFKAALAMALGLSDVVQSSAGGIQLETMFIDEGFGTLDSESLEAAIEVLEELQGGGTVVGVISHVSELKERIPKKIIVSGNRDGSIAEFRG